MAVSQHSYTGQRPLFTEPLTQAVGWMGEQMVRVLQIQDQLLCREDT